jgi:excinuclease UvrABC ATPase subunit
MRLRREARHVFVGGGNSPPRSQDQLAAPHRGAHAALGRPDGRMTISDLSRLSLINCRDFFNLLQLTGQKAQVGEKILKEITARLSFLINVGLDYLSLDRSAETLSGGEAQRIRLASQIGSGLTGVMYVLDEPSIGLHQRDNSRLLETLTRLRDLGNTVIVVEHDLEAIESADYVVDMGPGAGEHGGQRGGRRHAGAGGGQCPVDDRRLPFGPPCQIADARQAHAAQCAARAENPRGAVATT